MTLPYEHEMPGFMFYDRDFNPWYAEFCYPNGWRVVSMVRGKEYPGFGYYIYYSGRVF